MKSLQDKIVFWIRVSGWSCLLPASLCLQFYQMMQAVYWLFMVVIIALFAVWLLTTSTSPSWQSVAKLQRVILFTIFFVAIIPAIPLFVAVHYAKKL